MINKNDSLGIPNYGTWYLETLPEQNEVEEFLQINEFIKSVAQTNTVPEFQGREKRLQFINYGRTQLVFVLTVDEKRQYALLVNQPAAKTGVGKTEFRNLMRLSKNNSENVIKPLYYFKDKNNVKRELYVTPYYYQSRCIGIESREWGMWVPEPIYHFKEFSQEEREVINASMVALLIKLYDDEKKWGVSECRLDGGDFMLEKGVEKTKFNFEEVSKRMKLIAARSLISMGLEEYIDGLKQELSGNLSDDEKKVIIGKNIKSPMLMEEIEKGIEWGVELRNRKRENEIHL